MAKLFIGIFVTLTTPALALLRAYGAELGIDTPLKFFWATGALSSFLDNSPTYVVFLTAAGSLGAGGATAVATTVGAVASNVLLAISAGAVFMGAMTYIGNAPNFMVKSIAERSGVKMPSFFGCHGVVAGRSGAPLRAWTRCCSPCERGTLGGECGWRRAGGGVRPLARRAWREALGVAAARSPWRGRERGGRPLAWARPRWAGWSARALPLTAPMAYNTLTRACASPVWLNGRATHL